MPVHAGTRACTSGKLISWVEARLEPAGAIFIPRPSLFWVRRGFFSCLVYTTPFLVRLYQGLQLFLVRKVFFLLLFLRWFLIGYICNGNGAKAAPKEERRKKGPATLRLIPAAPERSFQPAILRFVG